MILSWAEQSGIWRNKGYASKICNDKPDTNFQNPELDDNNLRKTVYAIAPLQARNFVVMEVKANLIQEEREKLLAPFPACTFKRVARVVVGEPNPDFKKYSQQLVLKQKQEASDKVFMLQQLEEKRKKMLAKRQKELDAAKKKAEKAAAKEQKRLEREAKKQQAAAEKAAAEKAAQEKGEEKGEEDKDKE